MTCIIENYCMTKKLIFSKILFFFYHIFYFSHNQMWYLGKIEIALDEMVKCVGVHS